MNVREAAARLEMSPSLLYSLISAGKIRYSRIGHGRGRIRLSDDSIEEYLARNTFAPAEEKAVKVPRLKHLHL